MSGTLTKEMQPGIPGVPAVPPVPAHPAYDYDEIVTEHFWIGDQILYGVDPNTGNTIIIGVIPGYWVIFTTITHHHVPASLGSPGSPAIPAYPPDFHIGWTGAARSIATLVADGYYQFVQPVTNVGIVTGFTNVDHGPTYTDIIYGIYCTGSRAYIMENGATMAGPFSFSEGDMFTISRQGPLVRYFHGLTLLYASTIPSRPGAVYVDASLYYGSDTIESALLVDSLNPSFADVSGGFDGILGPVKGFMGTGVASLNGELEQLGVELDASADHLTGILSGLKSSMGGGGLNAILEGELTGLTGYAEAQQLMPIFGIMDAQIQPVSGLMLGLVGNIGGFDGVLGGVHGFLTNVGYAVMQDQLGQLKGFFITPFEVIPFPIKQQWTLTEAIGLDVTRTLAASMQVQMTMTTGLSLGRQLAGAVQQQFTMRGALHVERRLAGAIQTVMTTQLDVMDQHVMKAAFHVVGSLTASLSVDRPLAGAARQQWSVGIKNLKVVRPRPAAPEITVNADRLTGGV